MNRSIPIGLCMIICTFSYAQQIVEGYVRNAKRKPLVGATVLHEASQKGSITNENGFFSIGLPDAHSTLTVSFLGYKTETISVEGREKLDITLQKAIKYLEEVLVIGYGEKNKRQVNSAVGTLRATDIEQDIVPTFQRSLQGRIPGVVVTNSTGALNADARIRIRGTGSINAGNQPLFVIDGMILSDQTYLWTLGDANNPLLNIDPNDIASIQVLKDSGASAIYGSRGANGVVIITTKSGQYNSSPNVNIAYRAGFTEISNRYDLLNGNEYASLWNEAARNVGYDQSSGIFYSEGSQPNADWQSLLTQKGSIHQVSASVSGGTNTTRYHFSGSTHFEQSYLKSVGLQRYNVQAKIEQRLSDKLQVGISINPSRTVDDRAGGMWAGSAYGAALWFVPNVEGLDSQGKVRLDPIYTEIGEGGATYNPLNILVDQPITVTTNQILLNTHLTYQPVQNLELKTQFGAQYNDATSLSKFGAATFFGGFNNGRAESWDQEVSNINWINLVTYKPNLNNNHSLSFTAGTHLTKESFRGRGFSISNFTDDRLIFQSGGANLDWGYSENRDVTFFGLISRADYNYKDKYFLTFSTRYDGSSRFGQDQRYGFFPALSTGWILSEESFFNPDFIQFLKLRTSLGKTGNAQINDYTARGTVGFGNNYAGEPGFIIEKIENAELGWEENIQWDIGLDYVLWNERLSGSFGYYIKTTNNLLYDMPVPSTNGITHVTQNIGSIRNQGFEFDLNAEIFTGAFRWSVQLNGATLKNEVLELADTDHDGAANDIVQYVSLIRKGEPLGAFYLVEYAGVDPANGDALYYDLENNILANQAPATNRKVVGSPIPTFTGGITNYLSFQNFDLSGTFSFMTGHDVFINEFRGLANNMRWGDNQLRSQLNAWSAEQPITKVPQARLYENNGAFVSTRYLHAADYLRLNNLSFGYTIENIGQSEMDAHVSLAAQNLWTISSFPGLDPDSEFFDPRGPYAGMVNYNLPATRSYILGLRLNF